MHNTIEFHYDFPRYVLVSCYFKISSSQYCQHSRIKNVILEVYLKSERKVCGAISMLIWFNLLIVYLNLSLATSNMRDLQLFDAEFHLSWWSWWGILSDCRIGVYKCFASIACMIIHCWQKATIYHREAVGRWLYWKRS